MTIEQFHHVCRSAAAIAGTDSITVFGAAAVTPWLAETAEARPEAWPSLELDIDPGSESLATLVDGCIGELSPFEDEFGVRAHGVTLEIFCAPPDWRERARVFVEPASGTRILTPHPHDLVAAKLVRGDDRDWAFAQFVFRLFALEPNTLCARLESVARERREVAEGALKAAARVKQRGV